MIDCTRCKHKTEAASNGHCTQFQMMPTQIDECMMHSKFDKAEASNTKVTPAVSDSSRPAYIWLDQDRESTTKQHQSLQ